MHIKTLFQKSLLLSMGLLAFGVVNAKMLVLNVAQKGYPPYMLKGEAVGHEGFMTDIFRQIASELGYDIKVIGLPRKRVNDAILNGDADATPRAKEWTKQSERFVFSKPVVVAKDVLFVLQTTDFPYQQVSDLKGKIVGTHLGYGYPTLEDLFNSKQATRKDDVGEEKMLRRLLHQQVHVSVINEYVGKWLIKKMALPETFKVLSPEVGSFDYRFMFGKKWSELVIDFDKILQDKKESGAVEKMIADYTQ